MLANYFWTMTLLWRKQTFFFSQQVWIENSFLVRVPLHVYVSFLFWGFCLFLTFCTMSQSFFLCSYMHQPPSVRKTLFPWSHLQSYRLSSSNHHNMEWIWVIFVCSFLYVIKFWILTKAQLSVHILTWTLTLWVMTTAVSSMNTIKVFHLEEDSLCIVMHYA